MMTHKLIALQTIQVKIANISYRSSLYFKMFHYINFLLLNIEIFTKLREIPNSQHKTNVTDFTNFLF